MPLTIFKSIEREHRSSSTAQSMSSRKKKKIAPIPILFLFRRFYIAVVCYKYPQRTFNFMFLLSCTLYS